MTDERQQPRLPGVRKCSGNYFCRLTENSFDWQMITIIIALSRSRDRLDNLEALRSDSQIISSSG